MADADQSVGVLPGGTLQLEKMEDLTVAGPEGDVAISAGTTWGIGTSGGSLVVGAGEGDNGEAPLTQKHLICFRAGLPVWNSARVALHAVEKARTHFSPRDARFRPIARLDSAPLPRLRMLVHVLRDL